MRLLACPRETEKDEIVTGEQARWTIWRNDGVFVTVNAGKKSLTLFDGAQQVAAKFRFFNRK